MSGPHGTTGTTTAAAVVPLRFPFSRDDFTHRLLDRVDNTCLVERTNDRTGSVHWEVVVLRVHPAQRLNGYDYPAREGYPPSASWGESGWTYTALPDARLRMRFLLDAPDHSRDAWEAWWPRLSRTRPG